MKMYGAVDIPAFINKESEGTRFSSNNLGLRENKHQLAPL